MVELLLAKEGTGVLEAIVTIHGRSAEQKEGEWVTCNCQLPIPPQEPRLDGGDQSDPFDCQLQDHRVYV